MGKEIRRAMFAMAVGVLVSLIMTGVFGWLILKEMLDIAHIDLMAAGILIMGSGATAMSCGKGEGSLKRITGAELGVLLFFSFINLALFNGDLNGLLPCMLLITGTACAVILIQTGKKVTNFKNNRSAKRPISKLNKKYRR